MKRIILLFCLICVLPDIHCQIDFTASPKNFQLYPRDPISNLGEVIFTGKIKDADIDSIIILCIRTDGQKQRKSSFIDYSQEAGFDIRFNIEAVTKNHHFSIFLRKNDKLFKIDSVQNVVAGDAFVIQGQSNAQANMLNGDANVWQDTFVRSLGNPHPQLSNDANWYLAEGNRGFTPGSVGQIGMRLGRFLRDSLDIPIAIMNGAHGGRAIEFFQRNDMDYYDANTNYGRFLIRLRNAGLINHVRSIFFYQGESDGARAEIHKNLFEELYRDWKDDLKPLESFYVMQVREGCGNPSLQLRDYQRKFENYLPRLTSMTVNGIQGHDGCHYAFTGYTRIAQKLYYNIIRDVYSMPNPYRDIHPYRAWYSNVENSEITLESDRPMDQLTAQLGSELDFIIGSGQSRITHISTSANRLILALNTGVLDSLSTLNYRGHARDNNRWILNQYGHGMFSFYEMVIDSFHAQINYDNPSIMSGSGNAVDFDGIDDVIVVNTSLNASYSKEAWVFPKRGGNANNIVSSPGAALWMPGAYGFKLSSGHNGVWNQVQDSIPMPFYQWTHVAVTYDHIQKRLKLYKNGVLIDEAENVPAHNGQGLSIGGYTVGFTFKGAMDEVKVWDHVRSLDEIRSEMCQKLNGDETGLQAYFHFDELKGLIAPDLTGNTLATLTNFDTTSQGKKAWIRSAVPLGTSSNYTYVSEDNLSLSLPSGQQLNLSSSEIDGFVHIYFEEEKPNVIVAPEDYIQVDSQLSFGIYFLGDEMNYELQYDFEGNAFADSLSSGFVLGLLQRKNNAQPFWSGLENAQFEPIKVNLSHNTSSEFALVTKELITKIKNEEELEPLMVFPNPANEMFTIALPKETFDLQIRDIQGNIIEQKEGVRDEIRISSQSFIPGVYLIRITTSENKYFNSSIVISRE